jgi:hypothetical protein
MKSRIQWFDNGCTLLYLSLVASSSRVRKYAMKPDSLPAAAPRTVAWGLRDRWDFSTRTSGRSQTPERPPSTQPAKELPDETQTPVRPPSKPPAEKSPDEYIPTDPHDGFPRSHRHRSKDNGGRIGAEVLPPMARSRDFAQSGPTASGFSSHSTLRTVPAGVAKTTVLYGMATTLGGDMLVITQTLALAGDKMAKVLGREDLQNIHVIHVNDIKTPEHHSPLHSREPLSLSHAQFHSYCCSERR